MKKFYTSLLCLGFSAFCLAQEGQVTLKQDEGLEKLLNLYKESNKTSRYYTIQIHSSKASQGAQNAKEKAAKEFPDWPSTLDFINEYYKVTIGKFNTKFEAQQKLIEVKKEYPNALLIADQKEK